MVYRQEGHIIDIIWGLKIWFESLKKRGSGEINCYKAIQQFSSLISSTKTIAAIICKTCVVKASSNYKLIENINNPHRPDLLALSNVTRRIKKCEKKCKKMCIKCRLTHRSPLILPAWTQEVSHNSLFVNTAAWYCPVEIPCAPVNVAMSTIISASKSFFA